MTQSYGHDNVSSRRLNIREIIRFDHIFDQHLLPEIYIRPDESNLLRINELQEIVNSILPTPCQ